MKKMILVIGLLFSIIAQAAGPEVMATLDRHALQEPVVMSVATYNTASRTEILAFSQALLNSETLSEEQIKQRYGIKQVNIESLEKVRRRYWQIMYNNYRVASQDCASCTVANSMNTFRVLVAKANVNDSRARFHQHYLGEQLRLAALFPSISSEIDTFSSQEMTGIELKDGQFLLTFDDGPTAPGGSTDTLIQQLQQNQMSGLFFVLGENVQQRFRSQSVQQLAALYQNQCVGIHGWQHKSHSRWAEWQKSILDSIQLVKQTLPDNAVPLFRPPYGQRKADSATFFRNQGIRVILWNIDSQDWSHKVKKQQVADRVETLMLLWRKGIILFHDVHDKAPSVITRLHRLGQEAQLQWMDCNTFARQPL